MFYQPKIRGASEKFINQPRPLLRSRSVNFCQHSISWDSPFKKQGWDFSPWCVSGLCFLFDADPDVDFYLMRIQVTKIMRIHADPVPEHWMKVYRLRTWPLSGWGSPRRALLSSSSSESEDDDSSESRWGAKKLTLHSDSSPPPLLPPARGGGAGWNPSRL